MDNNVYKEIQEARVMGEQSLFSLREAKKYLDSAGNWGFVDIFGGGLISGLMKHSKINSASRCIDQARSDLRSFQKELADIDGYIPDVNIGDFLTFADFFFDGFIADMMVQSKISKMKTQVDEAISRVESILAAMPDSRCEWT